MAASHIPLDVWLQAIHLMCSCKKGFGANQFARILGVDIKTGWFIGHRIREAMDDSGSGALGGEGKIVESDETYTVHKGVDDVERSARAVRGIVGRRLTYRTTDREAGEAKAT